MALAQAISLSLDDNPTPLPEAEPHPPITRSEFLDGVPRLTRLVVEGLSGCLHSLRSLRNLELRRAGGDQNAAGRRALPEPDQPQP